MKALIYILISFGSLVIATETKDGLLKKLKAGTLQVSELKNLSDMEFAQVGAQALREYSSYCGILHCRERNPGLLLHISDDLLNFSKTWLYWWLVVLALNYGYICIKGTNFKDWQYLTFGAIAVSEMSLLPAVTLLAKASNSCVEVCQAADELEDLH